MCDFIKNYYIYTSCVDPGAHYFRTSMDGSKSTRVPEGPMKDISSCQANVHFAAEEVVGIRYGRTLRLDLFSPLRPRQAATVDFHSIAK
ncbi:hypothetical protein PG984_001072 [Apiospora sp. TS-2023a]